MRRALLSTALIVGILLTPSSALVAQPQPQVQPPPNSGGYADPHLIGEFKAAVYSDLLKTTMTGFGIIVSVMALLNALAGWAIYERVRSRLDKDIDTMMQRREFLTVARFYSNLSVMYWMLYDKSRDQSGDRVVAYREHAQGLASDAVEAVEKLGPTESLRKDDDELCCTVKQNLAYYLAEKADPADQVRAMELARYASLRAHQFRGRATHFLETQVFVTIKFMPPGDPEWALALDVLRKILNDPGLPQARIAQLRSKYAALLPPESRAALGLTRAGA